MSCQNCLELSEATWEDIEVTQWTIAFCPFCCRHYRLPAQWKGQKALIPASSSTVDTGKSQ